MIEKQNIKFQFEQSSGHVSSNVSEELNLSSDDFLDDIDKARAIVERISTFSSRLGLEDHLIPYAFLEKLEEEDRLQAHMEALNEGDHELVPFFQDMYDEDDQEEDCNGDCDHCKEVYAGVHDPERYAGQDLELEEYDETQDKSGTMSFINEVLQLARFQHKIRTDAAFQKYLFSIFRDEHPEVLL